MRDTGMRNERELFQMPVKSSAATAPVEPARVVPQATAAAATTPACTQHARWAEAKAALVLDDLRSNYTRIRTAPKASIPNVEICWMPLPESSLAQPPIRLTWRRRGRTGLEF